ncbi:hypothetical protein GCM10011490_20290 [Pseudoclavibacter endophyticus]|nr:hypothetical protein GCM10011490_20290 [Pseudoclavibacter endophyticus]
MAGCSRRLVAATVIVVLDNRDSYTYNLVQRLRERTDLEVRVVSADAGDEALRLLAADEVSGVVISPGPGHPDRAGDFAASGALIDAVLRRAGDNTPTPLLGVCLGHQGLARRFGYEVVPAPEPRHGWLSPLRHEGAGLFEGIPADTRVTRYHSLAIVPGPTPSPLLRVTARSEDAVIQAFEIESTPWFGVQFHPESIASADGSRVLANFIAVVERFARQRPGSVQPTLEATPRERTVPVAVPRPAAAGPPGAVGGPSAEPATLHVRTQRLGLEGFGITARAAARAIVRNVLTRGRGSFWLESALVDGDDSRWSVLGDASDVVGDGNAYVLRFRLDEPVTGAARHGGSAVTGTIVRDSWSSGSAMSEPRRVAFACDDPFAWLEGRFAATRIDGGEDLPFRGGHIGYFGYELGLRELGVAADGASTPDACWVRPSRYVVIDHRENTLTVCVAGADTSVADAALQSEARRVSDALRAAAGAPGVAEPDGRSRASADTAGMTGGAGEPVVDGSWRDDRAAYAAKIEACQRALRAGDSYELCLTTAFEVDAAMRIDALELFEDLAHRHPAPYAALVEFDDGGEPVAIVSASPERYLRGRDGRYETKPIKGTAARSDDPDDDRRAAASLATDPKTYAENLMIVDLLRNDLGRVCRPGSIEVPALMRVESYASLHQLVSTVRGVAEPGVTSLDVTRALFPGGSMTGAPKQRSVEILAELEGRPRGVYSGALGWLSADGQTELSIVIRTAVFAGGRWTIGAGGAIVLASEAGAETDEVELKALALRRAMARVAT